MRIATSCRRRRRTAHAPWCIAHPPRRPHAAPPHATGAASKKQRGFFWEVSGVFCVTKTRDTPVISSFTMDKFRRHFNETKLKQGTFLRSSEEGKEGDNEGGDTSAPEDKSEDNDESNGDDSDSKSSRKRYKLALPSESETRTAVDIDNPPVFAAVYRDAATKTDRVVICAGMFGIPDAKDVHVDLDEDDAQTAIISYGWPTALFSPQVMCATWASTDEPQTYYGRLNALDEELAHHRPSYSQAPRTTFRIRLPIPVNPDTSTWKKVGVNSATSGRFVLWELAANKPPYAVPLADKIVSEFVEHEPAETMQ